MTVERPIYDLESDSSSDIHPNIDKRSYKNWKKQQKEARRLELESRLEELRGMENPTKETEKEKEEIERLLKPLYVDVGEGSFRTVTDEDEDSYTNELCHLINNDSLEDFIELMERKHINLGQFEELVLLNLSSNIKEGNDELGLLFSKFALYIKYARLHGSGFVLRLSRELSDKNKTRQFEEDVEKHYLEAKNAILALYKEEGS
jgi:hypothetical protein